MNILDYFRNGLCCHQHCCINKRKLKQWITLENTNILSPWHIVKRTTFEKLYSALKTYFACEYFHTNTNAYCGSIVIRALWWVACAAGNKVSASCPHLVGSDTHSITTSPLSCHEPSLAQGQKKKKIWFPKAFSNKDTRTRVPLFLI